MSKPLTSIRRPDTDGTVTFGVLGPLEVRAGSRLLDVSGPQERALLALLLTAPGRVFSVSAIISGIWGEEPPGHAENTVQSYVSRLRRNLPENGASLVLTRRPGYLAAVDPEHVDAERFRTLAAAGRLDLGAGRSQAAASVLRNALALWRGEAYAEFDAPFAVAERTALDELRLTAVEDRIAADLALGAGPELVSELETLVGQHPWRERFWAQLMTALYRSGRQGDALGAFQRVRTTMIDDLGVEPGPALQAVQAQVLAHDPRLWRVDTSSEALPPALTVVGPTFVGRDAELTRLLEAYHRAASGSVERILLTGPHGMGKTRLLAELAQEAQARGALVRYGINEAWPQQTGASVVILLDDLQRISTAELTGLAERVVGASPPLLVVGSSVWEGLTADQTSALSRMFRDRMQLPPLQAKDIGEVVALYVPAEAVDDGIAAVGDAGGVPLQVHAAASRFGEAFVAAHVEEAAAGISGPRQHLSLSQERVAEGVLDLQRIRLVRAAHMPAEMPTAVCPYQGLAFFDVDDAPYFFGRERLVAHLVARLVDAPLLAVVGASGSGKSSVVRAGLVAAVRAGVLPGSENWQTVVTTPTQPPPDTAVDSRTLLVVDQFEELFTARSPAEQEEYADWLAGAASHDEVTVVVVVRSDYYAQAAAFPHLSDLLAANTALVGEMIPGELRQAIELPAAAVGFEFEAGLVGTIADDVVGEPGGLPLMSTALQSVWEQRAARRLTLAAYHAAGGVRTAVARLAENAFGQLTPTQQSIARRTLLRLAETGEGGEPVRRRVPIAEVAPEGEADARTVLDTLAVRRLITVSDSHVEVAHEALLREWPRLQSWLDEDEAGRKLRRHLAPAALVWQASGDAGELYRGARLAAALDWLRDHPDDLTEVEHDFLRAGQEAAEAEGVRRRRSIRRLRGLAIGLAIVGVLALVASLVAVNLRNEASRSALRADVRALQVRAVNEPRLDRALLYAAQAHRLQPSDESRWALLQTVQRSPEATAVFYADEALQKIAASADGTKVAASGFEGSLFVWDTVSRQRITIPDAAIFVQSLDISPDGRYIASVGIPVAYLKDENFDSGVVLVDLEQTPPSVWVLEGNEPSSARFAADGRTIVTVGRDGRVRYVDMQTGDVVRTLDFALPEETALVDSPENRRFMVAAARPENRGRVVVWEVETGLEVWSSDEFDSAVVSVSPDGSKLVIGHADGRIERADLNARGHRTPVPAALEDGLVDLAWSPDGSTFAGVTQEQTIVVWDAGTQEERAVLRGHANQVTQAVYSPDGKTIYASALDRAVLAWHWNPTGTKGVVSDHGGRPGPGVETALAADGSVAATRYTDGRVEVLDVASGASFEVEVPGELDWLAVDRIGRYVQVVVNHPSVVTVYVIDVQRRARLPHTFTLERQTAYAAEFAWDGQALVTAAQDRIDLWDLATGEQRSANLYQAADGVSTIALHPNGRLAALGEVGGAIEVIDLAAGKLEASLDPDPSAAERFAVGPLFSPDGQWLAASFENGRVVIWDTRSWTVHSVMETDGSLVFSPDSRILFANGAIWSIDGDLLGSISGVDSPVGISADGSTLVTFTERGVRSWNIAPDRLLEHACTVAGRNLTQREWSDVLPDRPYERTCEQYPAG